MNKSIFSVIALVVVLGTPALAQQTLDAMIDREIPNLVAPYNMMHGSPELSHYEVRTSAYFAERLRTLGYTVTENVGKFDRSEWKGHGVVAVLTNGPGPTVLVRTDMDAMPVEEKTGLPYASIVKTKNDAGQYVGVIQDCGHDIHITNMLRTAKMLGE